MHTVSRYHDISCGHRVYGHESKCAHLHGHNYRIHFLCRAKAGGLDTLGRVIDFSVIKERLCMWLEDNWDHRFLVWDRDPQRSSLQAIDNKVVAVPFNPTAENMASFLVHGIGPAALIGTGIELVSVIVEETAKCKAMYSLG